MSEHKVIGSRGIRVNIFEDDTEIDIALRIIRAALDEYNDRKAGKDTTNG